MRPSRPSSFSTRLMAVRNSAVVMSVLRGGNCALSVLRASASVAAKFGVAREQRVGDRAADVEVVQLGRPLLAGGFDGSLHLVEPALVVQPQAELRLRVLLGQPDAAQEHAQRIVRRTWSVVPLGSAPAAARRPPARLPAVSSSRSSSAGRRASTGTRLRAVAPSGNGVSAQRWQSIFSRCDLPLPKKPLTHAAFWLVCVRFERNDWTDPLDPVGVLPLADERRQLAAQLVELLLVGLVGDACLALVDQGMGGRISLKDVLDLHAAPPVLWMEIGTAM